ncbi:MAG: hypothetical protein AAFY29_03155 [Pseudomonadota bacterium]
MSFDWNAAATIAAPVIALCLGIWLDRRFEKKAKLFSYFGHVSSFDYRPNGGQPVRIHTHSVILRNSGRKSAANVRLTHWILPDFQVWPDIEHGVADLPNGSKDIVIPVIIPGQQITVSYLYFPPLKADQIHAGIRHEEGFAQAIPVLMQRQYPRWFSQLLGGLVLVGLATIAYAAYEIALYFWALSG